VQAIVAMGHSLQMQIIAEGVEHEDQMRILRELNCDCMQGFLLGCPLPPETIDLLLADKSTQTPLGK
jgi:EAL domain-containing protein (putative c-di-GMP-specific phosphodiesterase class I)